MHTPSLVLLHHLQVHVAPHITRDPLHSQLKDAAGKNASSSGLVGEVALVFSLDLERFCFLENSVMFYEDHLSVARKLAMHDAQPRELMSFS